MPIPEENVLSLSVVDLTPVTVFKIAKWTIRDTILSTVQRFVLSGWPGSTDGSLSPYNRRKDQLSTEQGVLLWGSHVIIPPQGREMMLKELHDQHPGIVRMKSLARSYIWWPNMDTEIGKFCVRL